MDEQKTQVTDEQRDSLVAFHASAVLDESAKKEIGEIVAEQINSNQVDLKTKAMVLIAVITVLASLVSGTAISLTDIAAFLGQ
jgi:hypothetical protein